MRISVIQNINDKQYVLIEVQYQNQQKVVKFSNKHNKNRRNISKWSMQWANQQNIAESLLIWTAFSTSASRGPLKTFRQHMML